MNFGDLFNKGNRKKLRDVDLGLSSAYSNLHARTVNKDGTFNVIRKGEITHIYHKLITMPWWLFLFYIFMGFTVLNGFFALIYLFIGIEHVTLTEPQGFIVDLFNMFHFSVQTMTTVGYGYMSPTGFFTSIVASLEALVGLISFGIVTGLLYGRFAKPTADIGFSNDAIITTENGQKCLQMRIANKRSHDIMDIQARLLMMYDKEIDGKRVRRYKQLDLEVSFITFMPLNWTINHIIDEKSPFSTWWKEEMKDKNMEFLLTVRAYDESFSHEVRARTSYRYDEVIWDAKWKPTHHINEKGITVFDIGKLDEFEKLG